jgi:hypothetical protein
VLSKLKNASPSRILPYGFVFVHQASTVSALRAGVKSISVGFYRSCHFSAQGNTTIFGVLSLAFLGIDHFTVPHGRPWLLSDFHQR